MDFRMTSELETLRWQYGLTWRLAEVHLPALTDDACLWEPAPGSWTVRKGADGLWRPDWSDTEPEPPPTVTIGWLSWHLIWWWSSVLAAARNEPRVVRESVIWPGGADAVVRRLQGLHDDWSGVLNGLAVEDLERPIDYPWPQPRPLRLALAWANSELMKNVAEIGSVRLLFEASRR
jgi:hypothetical protein